MKSATWTVERPGRDALAPLTKVPPIGISFRFGRLWGIEIGAHSSWLLTVALVFGSFGMAVYPRRFPEWSALVHLSLGAATAILFFVSLLVHELAHARWALRHGIPVKRVVLFALGGMALIGREARRPGEEFAIALAGPVASLGLGGLFIGLARWSAGTDWIAAPAVELAAVNLLLGVFNLLPGFPLDGGRILRAILWRVTGRLRLATRIAAAAGQLMGVALAGLGLWAMLRGAGVINGLWLVVLGWFIFGAASSADEQAAAREAMHGVPVRRVMSTDFKKVPATISVQAFVSEYLMQAPWHSFLAVEPGRPSGWVSLDELRKVPWAERDRVALCDALPPGGLGPVVDACEDVERAFWEMSEKELHQLPVVENGNVVGLVTRRALLQFLEARTG